MRFYSVLVLAIATFIFSVPSFNPAWAETFLIMFEDEGCPYCDLWKTQIGPIYPKTEESRIAPLMMVDIDDPLPEGIVIDSPPVFTPTFVLVHDGQEVDRLVGNPGEDFFWFLLDRMIEKLPSQETEGST